MFYFMKEVKLNVNDLFDLFEDHSNFTYTLQRLNFYDYIFISDQIRLWFKHAFHPIFFEQLRK